MANRTGLRWQLPCSCLCPCADQPLLLPDSSLCCGQSCTLQQPCAAPSCSMECMASVGALPQMGSNRAASAVRGTPDCTAKSLPAPVSADRPHSALSRPHEAAGLTLQHLLQSSSLQPAKTTCQTWFHCHASASSSHQTAPCWDASGSVGLVGLHAGLAAAQAQCITLQRHEASPFSSAMTLPVHYIPSDHFLLLLPLVHPPCQAGNCLAFCDNGHPF